MICRKTAIWSVQTVTWPVLKKRRKFEVGIYLSCDLDGHMTFFGLSYICHMTFIWHINGHIPLLFLSCDSYMLLIYLISFITDIPSINKSYTSHIKWIYHSYLIHITCIYNSYICHIKWMYHSYIIRIYCIYHSFTIHIFFIYHVLMQYVL